MLTSEQPSRHTRQPAVAGRRRSPDTSTSKDEGLSQGSASLSAAWRAAYRGFQPPARAAAASCSTAAVQGVQSDCAACMGGSTLCTTVFTRTARAAQGSGGHDFECGGGWRARLQRPCLAKLAVKLAPPQAAVLRGLPQLTAQQRRQSGVAGWRKGNHCARARQAARPGAGASGARALAAAGPSSPRPPAAQSRGPAAIRARSKGTFASRLHPSRPYLQLHESLQRSRASSDSSTLCVSSQGSSNKPVHRVGRSAEPSGVPGPGASLGAATRLCLSPALSMTSR